MITEKARHEYFLKNLDGNGYQTVNFVNRGHGNENDKEGTNNQEVLRMLIDRIHFLNSEVHWNGNQQILYHLRMALVLHEGRHLERAVEMNKFHPEHIETGEDGHFLLNNVRSHL